MPTEPLAPFAPPTALLQYLPSGISAGLLLEWFLYAVFAFWLIYTIVAVYHWIKYSHASWIAYPAIFAHLVVSFILFTYAAA